MAELLTKKERKSIIEEVCFRFHKDGIARLEKLGILRNTLLCSMIG